MKLWLVCCFLFLHCGYCSTNRNEMSAIHKFSNYVEVLALFYLQESFSFGVLLVN